MANKYPRGQRTSKYKSTALALGKLIAVIGGTYVLIRIFLILLWMSSIWFGGIDI